MRRLRKLKVNHIAGTATQKYVVGDIFDCNHRDFRHRVACRTQTDRRFKPDLQTSIYLAGMNTDSLRSDADKTLDDLHGFTDAAACRSRHAEDTMGCCKQTTPSQYPEARLTRQTDGAGDQLSKLFDGNYRRRIGKIILLEVGNGQPRHGIHAQFSRLICNLPQVGDSNSFWVHGCLAPCSCAGRWPP